MLVDVAVAEAGKRLSVPERARAALVNDRVLVDVAVAEAGKRLSVPERARAALVRAEKTLKTSADDPGALMARAGRRLRLGDNDQALADLNAVLAKSKDDSDALELRAIVLARLGKKDPARADLARYQKNATERSRLALAAVVAAELGDGTDATIEALAAALRKEPGDADLRYAAARALAIASKAVEPDRPRQGAPPWPGGLWPCSRKGSATTT